jgi:hypothetical protein
MIEVGVGCAQFPQRFELCVCLIMPSWPRRLRQHGYRSCHTEQILRGVGSEGWQDVGANSHLPPDLDDLRKVPAIGIDGGRFSTPTGVQVCPNQTTKQHLISGIPWNGITQS